MPRLARSWETDADGLTWTLHLREDVLFHDATPLDAEAVSLSLNRAFRADPLLSTLPIAAIRAAGEHTIMIETETPFSPLPGYLTSAATAILSPNSLNDEDEVQRPIATGPFKFESWKAREQITARRFDDYWGETAHLEKVVYVGIPDDRTRLSLLLSGEIHMARLLAPAALSRLETEPSAEPVTTVRMGRVNQLMLNTDRSPRMTRGCAERLMRPLTGRPLRLAFSLASISPPRVPSPQVWPGQTRTCRTPFETWTDPASCSMRRDGRWVMTG